ncbi:PLP-dependent transferase [Colletotrichum falcatum]|nr:PLP-dependent transferase [Colletotrichum falcatum]
MAPVGALLWRSLRTYQIYGANTDVGKTVFASILCNAARALWPREQTAFLKPVSTGPAAEADDGHIGRFAPAVANKTLFQFEMPASPHLAAEASDQPTPEDREVLRGVYDYASRRAAEGPGWPFIETAGGVHSPAPSGTPQADLYAPLRAPVVLVGDARLGSISQTISAFESLRIRGYDVESVLLFRDDRYRNHAYLADYFARRGRGRDGGGSGSRALLQPSFDGSSSWWTQGLGHANPELTLAASYAAGRYGHALLRGLRNPRLACVFYLDNGSTGMEVAVKMALRAACDDDAGRGGLLEILGLRGGYHGDTMGAMDAAEPSVFNEKVEWYDAKGFWLDYPSVVCSGGAWRVCVPEALRGDLGGGEFGALSDVFDVVAREEAGFGALVMEPVVLGAGGMVMATLVKVVRRRLELFGTAAPLARAAIDAAAADDDDDGWSGLPVVFDEVFSGLGRLGRMSAASFLGVDLDVAVNAKLLTGGLVPLCTTAASDGVALESLRELQRMDRDGEWDWAKTGGGWAPASGAGASKPAGAPEKSASSSSDGGTSPPWSVWSRPFVDWVSRQTGRVDGVWALGSVLAIHMRDGDGAGYSSTAAADVQSALLRGEDDGPGRARWNVHSRVLGNVLYVMTSQVTRQEDVQRLEALLRRALLA